MAEITKQALKVDNNTSFPNNNNGAITPSILRAFNTNMIDSMVDEIGYNLDSGSWNQQIDALEQFTASASGLTTGSLLITASAVSNVITFTKGNGSTFNVTVADTTDLSSLNAFTASATISLNNLNLWTSSYQPIITNLQASQSIDATKFTTIGTQSGSWDNTNLNAYTASNDTKWNTLGALSGSFVTESETGSFARTNASNTFTQANTFTSISASSFISASEFVGNGSKITGITASISLPILDEGIPQGNAFSMNFTGSAISAIVIGGTAVVSVNVPDTGSFNALTASFNTYTSSTDAKFLAVQASTASLNSFTASFNSNTFVGTASFNSYTQSNDQRVSSLETNSASVNTSISALNTFTASQSTASLVTSITNLNTFTSSQLIINTAIGASTSSLNTATASLFTSASLALVTASFDNGTRNLTFTKGNTTTFSVNIPDVSGSTGNFATTGSNTFIGNQTITGSLFISGNINMVNGADIVTHHVKAAGSNGLELQNASSGIIVSMGAGGGTQASFTGAVTANSISASTINGLGDPLAFSTSVDSRLDGLEGVSGSFVTTSSFNSYTSSTNSRLTNIESTTASLNTSVTNLNSFTASQLTINSGYNTFTQSQETKDTTLQNVTASLNSATASLFTSASLSLTTASFSGNTLTFRKGDGTTFGVVIPDVSGSTIDTGSLMVTGSVAGNILTFTKGDATTFSLTVATGSGGGGAAFPFTGDAVITGSLTLSGSANPDLRVVGNFDLTGSMRGFVNTLSVASSTASIDMDSGNFFILNLPTSSTTHIAISNIKSGQALNLQVSQSLANTGSIAFAPYIKFAGGYDYTATAITGALDLVSFVAFDSKQILATSVKNLL